jgi:dihydrofolate reductase
MQHNLVDEFKLMIHPIVIGKGKRLFNGQNGVKELVLKETLTFQSGIVVFIYSPC